MDIRYLVKLDGQWVYSLCILEGYSRKIVGSLVSAYQDELAILQVLYAAVNEYGAPAGIVSDNGAVFMGALYRTFLQALEMTPCYIAKGEPWQNLIEAQFKIQLRLADVKFQGVTTLRAIQHLHQQFVETFNTTPPQLGTSRANRWASNANDGAGEWGVGRLWAGYCDSGRGISDRAHVAPRADGGVERGGGTPRHEYDRRRHSCADPDGVCA
ncbi:DDE-type integrase/transposase/recombinase [Herpetosiphon gulosus]|uniref:DDE-type integrase/transposase/recombinase n=1 Tax=Herpetosiphon gulosus TaxID=1973496 RepID=UPI0031ECCE49